MKTIKISKTTFILYCLFFVTQQLLAGELSVSTGISYSADTPHNYDMLGDEMGFHLLVNQNGAITHYLLDNDGDPVTSPANYTKTFETSGAKAASIAKAGDKLAVIYEKSGDLKIWVNDEGGLTSSWVSKLSYDYTGSSLQRISSKGYENNIHIAWDTGSSGSQEAHYIRFDLLEDDWYDYKNVSDVTGDAGNGQWPDIEVTDYDDTVRVHITYENPDWVSYDEMPPKSPSKDSQVINGVFNRDREFPGSWESEVEIVEQKTDDEIEEAGFTSPFICSFSDQSKLFNVYTYADYKPPDPMNYYTINRHRSVSSYGEDTWTALHAQSIEHDTIFVANHYAYCDAFGNSEILYWAHEFSSDSTIRLLAYENNAFSIVDTIGTGDFPKISANSICSRYVTWQKNNYIWISRKYRGDISGTISENTLWNGDISVDGDVTVNSGVTLTIVPDTEVTFGDSDALSSGNSSSMCELIVNGTLKAEGATFTAASVQDWYGIRFTSSSSSSCELKDCTVENGDYNIRIEGSSPTIDSCVVDGGRYGVYTTGSGADPSVSKCDIKNVTYGIGNYTDSAGDFYDNKLSASSRCIYVYNGDGNFYSNSINYSGGYGACIVGSSSNPDLTGTYNGTERGNYFDSNLGNDVIYVAAGSPRLGDDYRYGYNHFEGVPTNRDYIDNNTGSSLKAECNYWEDGTEPSASDFDGTVDYTPWESDEPDAGTTWKKSAADALFADALQAFRKRDYEEVISIVPQALEADADHSLAHPVLNRYYASTNKLGGLTLNSIKAKQDDGFSNDIKQIARVWEIYYYAHSNQMADAEKVALSAPKGSLFERALLLDVLHYYSALDDKDAVARVQKIMTDHHKDEDIFDDIQMAIEAGVEVGMFGIKALPKKSASLETIPQSFAIGNYPNPCNPITNIHFSLPNDGHIKISIFNMRGRRVCELVDRKYDAGHHIVQWNGRDDHAHLVATGIYFYKVQFEQHIRTNKLLVIK